MHSFHCAEPRLRCSVGSETDVSRPHVRISFHWCWLPNTEQASLPELVPQLCCDHVTPAALLLSVGPRGASEMCARTRAPTVDRPGVTLQPLRAALYGKRGQKLPTKYLVKRGKKN